MLSSTAQKLFENFANFLIRTPVTTNKFLDIFMVLINLTFVTMLPLSLGYDTRAAWMGYGVTVVVVFFCTGPYFLYVTVTGNGRNVRPDSLTDATTPEELQKILIHDGKTKHATGALAIKDALSFGGTAVSPEVCDIHKTSTGGARTQKTNPETTQHPPADTAPSQDTTDKVTSQNGAGNTASQNEAKDVAPTNGSEEVSSKNTAEPPRPADGHASVALSTS